MATVATRASLPAAKLIPPRLPGRTLTRPRLLSLLEHGLESKVTLLSAPAGYGKTTLLADWGRAASVTRRTCWVSLDEDDNARARLLQAMSAAVRKELELPAQQSGRLRLLRRTPETWSALLNRIGSLEEPLVLVLDDVHLLHAPVAIGDLTQLVRDAPENLRIVLSTRSDPALPLERYRLWDQLTEIRAADLAMTTQETRALLGALDVALEDGEIEALRERTEGWPAAICLAAISLQSADDPGSFLAEFYADDRPISDYLLTEVLSRQPYDLRLFLLRTSVAERLTPELATQLTGRTDAGAVLAQLVRGNLFTRTGGSERPSFSYHPLFRAFLQAELARLRPQEVRDLHGRVAGWSEQEGRRRDWLRHALRAADWSSAARAAAATWPRLAFFEPPGEIGRIAEAVPADALDEHPSLALLVALALLERDELEECRRRLGAAEVRAAEEGDPQRLAPLQAFARMSLARLEADYDELERSSRELLDLSAWAIPSLAERRALRAAALVNLGIVSQAHGEPEAAEATLEEALDVAQLGDATSAYVDGLSQLALLDAASGRLRRASELAGEAIDLANRRGWSSSVHAIAAYLALGWAHYHWAENDHAEAHLSLAADAARATGDRPAKGLSSLLSLYCLAAQGPAGATQAVRQLRGAMAELDGLQLAPFFAGLVAAAPPALLAARGDLDEAQAALDESTLDRPEVRLVGARVALARGDVEQARAHIDAALASQPSRVVQVEAWVLRALAQRQQRERGPARESLEHALELGEPDHCRRAFLGAGPAARAALVELIREGTAHRSFVAELLAAFDERAPRVGLTPAEVLEPLSEREKAILRYLPTMMSNVEIAAELFLSINTVKTHLRHVYRKLGVTRRRDAVERARELSLL